MNFIDLNDNNLTTLPAEFGNLQNFGRVELRNNQITSLPPEIGNGRIGHFYLENNQLTTLPQEIGNLNTMQTLNLNNNRLTSLPNSIGAMTRLTDFRLNNNELTTIPASIGNLQSLGVLQLTNNQLTALPDGIVNAANLFSLHVENNQLTALPDSIGKLSLSNLQLANNKIAELPASFLDLPLQNLDLENNDLERFPPGITTSMSFGPVGSLNIHGNRLCTLITQGVADWLDSQAGTGGWRQTQRCNVGAVGYAQGPGSPFTVSQNASTLQIVFKENTDGFKAGVYNQAGRVVAHLQSEGGVAQWDVSGTQRGVYIVRVREGRDSWERKVVVEP